jgi:hypothetical protein
MTTTSRSFRYSANERWFKGNTHIHSTASDGAKTHDELGQLYAAAGYDFLFATDHKIASDMENTVASSPLLWLDGIEIDGSDNAGGFYHVVCLGKVQGISAETPLVEAMESARKQNALIVLAHPHWMGNTLDDALRWGFDAVEIYSHISRWLNGKSEGLVHWQAMLKSNPATLGLSVDDAHISLDHPGWNGGWVMVNSAACSRKEILDAIRRGNYYSTCGPEFLNIESDGTSVNILTSPVQFVRLVGPDSAGDRLGSFDGKEITSASMKIPFDWPYVYLEVEDRQGRRAWTNTLLVADKDSRAT